MGGASFFSVFVLCLMLTGCLSLPNQPKVAQPKGYTMPGSMSEVWQASLITVLDEYIPIETKDEANYTFKTSRFKIEGKEYSSWAKATLPAPHGYGQFQLQVISHGEHYARIQIETQFQAATHSTLPTKGRYHVSTGVFESGLASRIHMYVVMKKYPNLARIVTGFNFRWNETLEYYQVSGVEPGSLGAEQGFENGDIIVQYDGVDMTMENFFDQLTQVRQTQVKPFFVDRFGSGIEIQATVFYVPTDVPPFGFQVERNSETKDFYVTDIVKDSPAQQAHLQVGDILLQEEKVQLLSWHDYYGALTTARKGVDRHFLIERGSEQKWITIKT